MILTVTMNPSVDMSYQFTDFQMNEVNRIQERNVKKTAGGKGLNVTRVLQQLEAPVLATGVLGGVLGGFIRSELSQVEIAHDFLAIEQATRNCLAILTEDKQTEILESGPLLSQKNQADFISHFKKLIQQADVVTISGSLPRGVKNDYYTELIKIARSSNIPVILDCSGEALKKAVSSNSVPNWIKPNHLELSTLVDSAVLEDYDSIYHALQHPILSKVPNILVSMGGKGAFVKTAGEYHCVNVPKISVVNSVGSGDATVAGLAAALVEKQPITDVIKTAMTCGILNTLEATTGKINPNDFQKYFEQVVIQNY